MSENQQRATVVQEIAERVQKEINRLDLVVVQEHFAETLRSAAKIAVQFSFRFDEAQGLLPVIINKWAYDKYGNELCFVEHYTSGADPMLGILFHLVTENLARICRQAGNPHNITYINLETMEAYQEEAK